jgi:hypothetical protein
MGISERIERLLRGAVVKNVVRREHSWNFYFSSGEVSVEHLWRIIENGSPVLTDREDGLAYGEPKGIDAEALARDFLVGRRVLGALIDPETADMRISFEGNLRLDVLTIAPRTAAWEFDDGQDLLAVARCGRISESGWIFKDAPQA